MKKITINIIGSIVLLGVILYSGCGKEQEKIITICTEADNVVGVQDLAKAWEKEHPDIRIEVLSIPTIGASAETALSELRTEIMAGEGPDVFLLSGPNPNVLEETIHLFEIPEVTMNADIFLPLDQYIDHAEYTNWEMLNQKILQAGKTEEGQMLIPVSYTYYAYVFREEDLAQLEALPVTWEQVVETDNPYLQQKLWGKIGGQFHNAFGKVANYEEGTFLLSKELLLDQLESTASFLQSGLRKGKTAGETEEIVGGNVDREVMELLMREQNQSHHIWALPNIEKGVTANICLYAGVNRNTEYPEEAFSVVDMLLSDEVQSGRGFKKGDRNFGTLVSANQQGFSVNQQSFDGKLSRLNQEDADTLKLIEEKISTVRFLSEIDCELCELFSYVSYGPEKPDKGEAAVQKTLESVQMKLSE